MANPLTSLSRTLGFSGFNIDAFRQSFKAGEPQRTNQFNVTMIPPIGIFSDLLSSPAAIIGAAENFLTGGASLLTTASTFNMRCSAVRLPGKSINTFDYQQIVGPTLKIATGTTYDAVTLEVIMSQTGLERALMMAWVDYIQPTQGNLAAGLAFNMDVKYYDTYTSSATINLFSSNGVPSYSLILNKCFPVSVGATSFSWSQGNQIATFEVLMAYENLQTV